MKTKLEEAKSRFDNIIDELKNDLASVRAGRANQSLVDSISVEAYGQRMPINQLANINIVDATLITIQAWDKANIPAISKAISQSDLGINPSIDGELIRLPVPPLTEERRLEYVKLVKNKIEEARIKVRQARKDILLDIEENFDNKLLSEDEFKREEKSLQELVDQANQMIEEIGNEKEEELLKV